MKYWIGISRKCDAIAWAVTDINHVKGPIPNICEPNNTMIYTSHAASLGPIIHLKGYEHETRNTNQGPNLWIVLTTAGIPGNTEAKRRVDATKLPTNRAQTNIKAKGNVSLNPSSKEQGQNVRCRQMSNSIRSWHANMNLQKQSRRIPGHARDILRYILVV